MKKTNKLFSKGQGTIEYLVIIGIVIVLSLAVVGIVLTQSSSVQESSATGNKLGMAVQAIGVTQSLVDSDGNFVIQLLNNSGDVVTISDVSIGGTSVDFSQDLAQGNDKFFRVDTDETCENGKVVSKDVVVTYVNKYGITKTERYPSKVMFNCSDFSINATFLADQCAKGYASYNNDQNICYAADGTERDCSGTGEAAEYYNSSFNHVWVNGTDTVLDSTSDLRWQKNYQGPNTWQDALTYCNNLNASNGGSGLDGYTTGWRLPTVVEYLASNCSQNGCSPYASLNWTSSDAYGNGTGTNVYGIYTYSGDIFTNVVSTYTPKSMEAYFHCVRFES